MHDSNNGNANFSQLLLPTYCYCFVAFFILQELCNIRNGGEVIESLLPKHFTPSSPRFHSQQILTISDGREFSTILLPFRNPPPPKSFIVISWHHC